MGSKKLKAVVVLASRKILAQDKDVLALVKSSLAELGPMAIFFRSYGTTGITSVSAMTGDSPVKNWGGAGVVDFLQAQDLKGDNFNAKMKGTLRLLALPHRLRGGERWPRRTPVPLS